MPGKCSICNHPNRLEIERKILEGVPYREIARQYCVCKSSVGNHVKKHILKTIEEAWRERRIQSALNIFDVLGKVHLDLQGLRSEIQALVREAWKILDLAQKTGAANFQGMEFLQETLDKLSNSYERFLKLIEVQARMLGLIKGEKEEP
ncbi:MAG: hypothetical protein ACPL7L_00765 [bacterium]